ncbi:hypothetical protein VQ03_26885 [Methylobacterium tarhaniae]|uniref:NAD-glutamate dehydrogenase N-terminal ACT1 domain-containing protein n=2 Tax=Methylobacterium tarhaniae TaxID=1187852 RepID=A0A0J6S8P7_9HYPH|nr:hypothetical protein VQ03_26885 [Methylobacterium tarhaniae]
MIRDRLIEAVTDAVGGQAEYGEFVRDLFGRVSVDDLGDYAPASLATLTVAARDHLARPRRPGRPADVALHDVRVTRGRQSQGITVVEVVDDNRPFLLDSTLAALTAHGLSPDLVAHPILGVERDSAGVLRRLVGETTAEANDGWVRESLIHIHVDRIEGEDR